MIRSSKSYLEAAEKMKPYFKDCRQLKSSKNKVVLTGTTNFDNEQEELKVTIVDNEPQTINERELFAHISKQVPEVENIFMCKSLIKVERKVGKKWIDSTTDFINKIENRKKI